MAVLIIRYIDFRGCRPDNHYPAHPLLYLELANILTKSLHHIPTSLAVFHMVSIQTLGKVLVERSLQWLDFLQLVTHWLNVLGLEHLGIDCCLIGILRIEIPNSELDVIQLSQWHDVSIVQILFVFTFSNANFVILGNRTNRFSQTLAGHKYSGYECSRYCTAAYHHDSQFSFSRFHAHVFHR